MASISSLVSILAYGIALCGFVPLFPWLEPVPRLILVAGMAAGIWQDRRGAWPLKNWMFNAAIVPVFLYYAVQFSRSNPLQPVVSVLAIMLAVRLAGPKNARHYLQISALSLFCLSSSSLFDLSPLFLAYLALMLFLVAVSLVLLTFYAQDRSMGLARPDLRRVLAAGILMPLASLPLLIFFFPLLPRTPVPLWNFRAVPASHVSGFSDQVEPGSSSSIGASRVLAFRAEMLRQSEQQLYWRGTVFNRIEGRRWVRSAPPSENSTYTGKRINQTIYPEPGLSHALLALDAPASLELPRSRRLPDGVYELLGSAGRRFDYTAESILTDRLPTTGIKRSFYLTLPDNLSERIKQLAESIRHQGGSDAGRLEQLESFYRNGGFRYSMTGLPTGEHALEQFLFEGRQGHCEFFASSFALVLRAAGVPARLVGGYLGGEYNQQGGYYLVTEDRAHVWVEVYIAEQGWLRVDPSSFAQNAGAVWGATAEKSLLHRISLMLDSLDHTWNRAVITYNFERQVDVARMVGKQFQGFEAGGALKGGMPFLAVLVGVVGIIAIVLRRKKLFPSREERLLRAFYRRVERDCRVRPEQGRVGLFELAALTGNPKVRAFADIYAGAVYRDKKLSEDECKRLKELVRRGFA